jgi:hypothetical protein
MHFVRLSVVNCSSTLHGMDNVKRIFIPFCHKTKFTIVCCEYANCPQFEIASMFLILTGKRQCLSNRKQSFYFLSCPGLFEENI